MGNGVSIFGSKAPTGAVDILRETLSVDFEAGRPVVRFNTSKGRGNSGIALDADDFRECAEKIAVLAATRRREEDEPRLSPAEMIERTWTVDEEEGTVSFRAASGRGIRSIKMKLSEVQDVAEILLATIDPIEGAARDLLARVAAEEAKANKR